jgi:alkanesulfonate monooxygenase SsuD/methylene tetrahydromethanopterin reductase-like flavin-dependent oxidoreductase (luciferase family)
LAAVAVRKVLDNISDGRVDLAVGVWTAPGEFVTFSTPIARRAGRAFEPLRVIEHVAGEPFDDEGKYYTFRGAHVTNNPCAKPWAADLGRLDGEQNVR